MSWWGMVLILMGLLPQVLRREMLNRTLHVTCFRRSYLFDDQEKHLLSASTLVPSGHAPSPHASSVPVISASWECHSEKYVS